MATIVYQIYETGRLVVRATLTSLLDSDTLFTLGRIFGNL